MTLLIIFSFSFYYVYSCKRLIVFNYKYVFLQSTEIFSSNFNLLSVVTLISSTDFVVLDVVFAILNVLLVLLVFLLYFPLAMLLLWAYILVVSDLRSETKSSRFESGCYLCAEVSSLQ